MIVKFQYSRRSFSSSGLVLVVGLRVAAEGGVLSCIVALMYQTLRMTAYHSLHLLYN